MISIIEHCKISIMLCLLINTSGKTHKQIKVSCNICKFSKRIVTKVDVVTISRCVGNYTKMLDSNLSNGNKLREKKYIIQRKLFSVPRAWNMRPFANAKSPFSYAVLHCSHLSYRRPKRFCFHLGSYTAHSQILSSSSNFTRWPRYCIVLLHRTIHLISGKYFSS